MFPQPRALETAFVGLQIAGAALKLLRSRANERAGTLTSFELLPRIVHRFLASPRHRCARSACGQARLVCADRAVVAARRRRARTLEASWTQAMEDGLVDDAVIAANLTSARLSGSCATRCRRRRSPKAARSSTTFPCRSRAVPDFIAEATPRW